MDSRGLKNFFETDSSINAMAVNREGTHLAVAGRSFLKVFNLSDRDASFGHEQYNLRSSSHKSLNFSNNDVAWCQLDDNILATAATNGAVVVWNIQHSSKPKNQLMFNEHKRTVNRVCFHNSEPYLLSGSQDGCIKLFDLRERMVKTTFTSNSESVRDVKFSPSAYSTNHFVSAQETGNIEIWDIRRPDKPEANFLAHDGPINACEWHPNDGYRWLATGGRDKTIKIWDLTNRSKPGKMFEMHSIGPVSKLSWRPSKDFHIATTCSIALEMNPTVYVWDIKRSYVPYATFGTRKQLTKQNMDQTCGFAWKNDPNWFVTACKSGTVYQHCFDSDAYYPAEKYKSVAIDFNPSGDVSFALSDFVKRYSALQQQSRSLVNSNNNTSLTGSNFSSSNLTNDVFNSPNLNNFSSSKTSMTSSSSLRTKTPSINASLLGSGIAVSQQQQPSNQSQQLSSSLTQTTTWDSATLSSSMADVKQKFGMIGTQYFGVHPPNSVSGGASSTLPSNQSVLSLSGAANASLLNYSPNTMPIRYRTSPEAILTEHFRCKTSQLMTFLNEEMTEDEDNLQEHLSMRLFIVLAKKYALTEQPFEELCEFNARICEKYGRPQVAQTWRQIRHMFSVVGRHPTSSEGGPGNNPSGGSIPTTIDLTVTKTEVNRHSSGGAGAGGRHLSGQQPPNLSAVALNANNSLLKEDSAEDDDIFERGRYFKSLTQGALGTSKFAVDFFDAPTSVDSGNSANSKVEAMNFIMDNKHEWELQRESILHRHNIGDYNTNELPVGTDGLYPDGGDTGSPLNVEEEEETVDEAAAGANVQSLLASRNISLPPAPFNALVGEMLRQYVDNGDLQTAMSIILVLGDRMKQVSSINRSTIIVWFRSYIEMVQRFQLWNVSSRLLKMATDSEIQALNQTATTVSLMCAKCRRMIKVGSICDKCQLDIFNCSICHVAVRGLYMWCHGCGHGGHSTHIRQWFNENSQCPTGCGHQCKFY